MEEKIKEIIFKNFCKSDGTHYESAAKEIADIQRRFTRWCIINIVVLYSEDDSYICLDDESDRVFKSVDELFEFWNELNK